MTLKLQGSTSGHTAIEAPASAGSNTITLPANNGSANQYLKNTGTAGILEFATLAGGKILQVAFGENSTEKSIQTTTYTDTNLTGTIQPSATSSKILVIVNQRFTMDRQNISVYAGLQLLRDSSVIVASSAYAYGFQDNSSTNWLGYRDRITIIKMDQPASTSTLTYKTQGKVENTSNGSTLKLQEDNEVSTLLMIEVGA